ncbi:hypothetical protein [Bradyrhizobium sp. 192]|uniref:hypothetical protein n=1 Tax=Bradyrhizobium sp. 192 TaxID=2782660 RepID=UPI001FFE556E|nr:hypothetical protein [Bradyrhizobium sp. 192]UPJ60299.1 hypothetical protein IVB24_12070 [Bradyrhizobium sp. 192]
MLTRLLTHLDPARIKPDFPAKLRRLAEDCEGGEYLLPGLHQPKKAPPLEDRAPTVTPQGLLLIDYASDLSVLGDGPLPTSPLCFADPGDRLVRTLSGFYRLGAFVEERAIRRRLPAAGAVRGDVDGWGEQG